MVHLGLAEWGRSIHFWQSGRSLCCVKMAALLTMGMEFRRNIAQKGGTHVSLERTRRCSGMYSVPSWLTPSVRISTLYPRIAQQVPWVLLFCSMQFCPPPKRCQPQNGRLPHFQSKVKLKFSSRYLISVRKKTS